VRQKALKDVPPNLDLGSVFQQSRDHGLQPENLNRIAFQWAPRLGLSGSDVRSYLTENIHYSLDAECIDGMNLFFRYAYECGALPKAPPLHFLEHKFALR
jgi:chorismate dehydratase